MNLNPSHATPHQASTGNALQLRTASAQETIRFGERLGQQLTGGDVLALTGDLGAGKTVLTCGIALGLGIPMDQVSSPTFTLIQEYPGTLPLIHVDLYRLEGPSDISTLGLEEYFTPNTIVLIEWAERFPQILPSDHMAICLEYGEEENIRSITLSGTGPKTIRIVTNIQRNLSTPH
ncbi:MAG: tRNA (adenosine(37)-N6)-threonylcarbamoyltransferase complex ATPase subunit type 1 TsaE [Nitrospiraceae bacterium]|nr:tRNA (adenosine(37)-N6)-threonylcarbamoyltransferase complex ATPase subunit type 1 TsaE [Nitrospira sp.]MCB9776198.1 tRNA (adenosine(37)-N6)-threonylcarbamoyltransferase complex ATPase subunit type 1 TsaE [Nitrospiraceae bacterium]